MTRKLYYNVVSLKNPNAYGIGNFFFIIMTLNLGNTCGAKKSPINTYVSEIHD